MNSLLLEAGAGVKEKIGAQKAVRVVVEVEMLILLVKTFISLSSLVKEGLWHKL